MPRPSRASSVRPPRPVLNALGQITPLGVTQWCQQPVVDRQQIQFGHAGEQPRIGAIATPDGQLMQQARQTDVGGREAAATRPLDEATGEKAPADACGAGINRL